MNCCVCCLAVTNGKVLTEDIIKGIKIADKIIYAVSGRTDRR